MARMFRNMQHAFRVLLRKHAQTCIWNLLACMRHARARMLAACLIDQACASMHLEPFCVHVACLRVHVACLHEHTHLSACKLHACVRACHMSHAYACMPHACACMLHACASIPHAWASIQVLQDKTRFCIINIGHWMHIT